MKSTNLVLGMAVIALGLSCKDEKNRRSKQNS
jgi:hypothetical protein